MILRFLYVCVSVSPIYQITRIANTSKLAKISKFQTLEKFQKSNNKLSPAIWTMFYRNPLTWTPSTDT